MPRRVVEPFTLVSKALSGELGRDVERLGVKTLKDLRERGWKEVLRELVSANPKRLNNVTALSLCAAEMGKRPSDVGESRLNAVGAFVWMLKARREQESAGVTAEDAMKKAVERDTRRTLSEARRYARAHGVTSAGAETKKERSKKNAARRAK
ncbi:hypothetical protein BH11MYX4_BH11MYX4_17490 [soil metagenome]